MQFNLIDEQWIPVRRRDGSAARIAPHEVTKDFADNPVVALDSPRPDFNGALIQFLIGLVQTVAYPINGTEWRKSLDEPPAPEELLAKFSTVHHAFELGGKGPRFMQAFEPFEDYTHAGIAGLLIDAPGNNALVNNIDHFVKRRTVNRMCPSCCATALFTSQINAYGDGPGYRTSLRGGSGPLTTLVISDERHDTLWQALWLNILEKKRFLNLCADPSKTSEEAIFPWLAPTRTSEKETGMETTPGDVHPAQMFWSMSQRIKLNIDEAQAGSCEICGKSDRCIGSFNKKNHGVNYTGSWIHPLTPYTRKEDGSTMPAHGERGGLTYRHWLGYIFTDTENNRSPAVVVREFYGRTNHDWQFRLWVFGYDIYNSAKIRGWYEAKMPLLFSDNDMVKRVEAETANLISGASEINSNTKTAIKRALFSKVKKINKKGMAEWATSSSIKEDREIFQQVTLAFWQESENEFYQILLKLKECHETDKHSIDIKKTWNSKLCEVSERIFSTLVMSQAIEDVDPKRVVIARSELEIFNRSKKIKELLGIPVEKKDRGKETKVTKDTKQIDLPL